MGSICQEYRDEGWIPVEEQVPANYGYYEVMRRQGKYHVVIAKYLWNGSYWVTEKHSVTHAVIAWRDVKDGATETEPGL